MKRTTRRNKNNNSTSINSNVKENVTMKRTRKSNNSVPTTPASSIDPKISALLSAFGITIPTVQASEQASEQASDPTPAFTRTKREYQNPDLTGHFRGGLTVTCTSDAAKDYYNTQRALCEDVMSAIEAPIMIDLVKIGVAPKDPLACILALCDTWEIPAQSMRVIIQILCPVIVCCCEDTNTLARHVYGMKKANSLMGSACNSLMYNKAASKAEALPFVRTCYNVATLGLDFDTDFDEDANFEELCVLCELWLNKCTLKAQAQAQPQPKRQSTTPAQAPIDIDSIIKALQALK